jgi:Na+/H+-dicarboxylate symporter
VPDHISDEVAAQIFIVTMTVVGLVEAAAVPKVSLITAKMVCKCIGPAAAACGIRPSSNRQACRWRR